MRIKSAVLGLALALSFGLASTPATAQEAPHVIVVLTIDVNGDLPGFLKLVSRARQISAQYESRGQQRVWQATLAGAGTNEIFVAVEYPSLVAYAQDTSKLAASSEWQQFIRDFQAAGMCVVSNSMSVERTPM